MIARSRAKAAYERPEVADYGSLRDITAHIEHVIPGFSASGVASVPTGHPPGGDNPPPGGNTPPPGGDTPLGSGDTPDSGISGGEHTSSGGLDHGVAGAEQGGGGGGGGTVSTGGGEAALPFTGFPIAVAAAVGGAIASAGAALRRAVRRR